MKQYKNYSLLHLNTFGIDCQCDYLLVYESTDDAVSIAHELHKDDVAPKFLILGGGSNLLLTQDFKGRVITADKRFDVTVSKRDDAHEEVFLRCWAGTTFDEVVEYAVGEGYYGLENLSLIPGECGASGVQNIGAYGVEAKDLIDNIEAVELATGNTVCIKAEECAYGYRQSRFKNEWKNRYLITYITYRLSLKFRPHLDYGNIRKVLEEKNISADALDGKTLREVIVDIRRAKLPDPKDLGNAGSFFMNPIIDEESFLNLKAKEPDVRYFEVPGTNDSAQSETRYKIPAGWMIDQCGWKGRRVGTVGVYDKQALVLVNHGGATGNDVVKLMNEIQADVFSRFGIHIYPEVNII